MLSSERKLGAVLVTGAGGFIGRHLVERLRERSDQVRVLTRRPHRWPDDVQVASADLSVAQLPPGALDGIDLVLHLAGKAHDAQESLSRDDHHAVTVQGTNRLLEAAVRSRVKAIVFVSSLAVYGPTDGGPIDEQAPCRPTTNYGRAKLMAEGLILQWGEATGGHAAIVRPAMVYGPGCPGNLPRMIRAIQGGWFPPIPETGARRSVLHVDGAVDGILAVARHPAARGQAFNVADERAYTAREMYVSILSALGRPTPQWTVPVAAINAAAAVGDMLGRFARRRLPFDSIALERLTRESWFSAEELARRVGYRSSQTLEQTLPSVIAAMAGKDSGSAGEVS